MSIFVILILLEIQRIKFLTIKVNNYWISALPPNSVYYRNSNYKPNILKFSYRWEGLSKYKLLKTLEEQNIMEEMIHFENYKFQENDTGIELAESQFSKILENLARRSCKLVKSFKKNKNSKKKPWVDRELSDLKKTVIQLGSALKKTTI